MSVQASKSVQFLECPAQFICAVECKNVGSNAPVVLGCVPISSTEAFHCLINSDADTHRVTKIPRTLYGDQITIGKSSAQVGIAASGGTFWSSDSDISGKWSQCLSSAIDLIHQVKEFQPGAGHRLSAIIPFVVVPDERLWSYEYDGRGNRTSDPMQIENCPYYVGRSIQIGSSRMEPFIFSHIEFCTESGFTRRINQLLEKCGDLLFDLSGL